MAVLRRCSRCHIPKPETKEYFHSNGKDQLRYACKDCENARKTGNLVSPPSNEFMDEPPPAKRYVITYAQNATPPHPGFFAALQQYCAHNDAQLLIMPGRYKNPSSRWTVHMEHDDWWHPDFNGYLFHGRAQLGHYSVYADIRVQPTAVTPLTGFEAYAGSSSVVIPHPKIQLETVAVAASHMPRIFTTTGAVTLSNYSDSKAGKKGEIHHIYGAAIIELADDGHTYMRHINAESDGSFIDLTKRYMPIGVEDAPPAAGLVCGDIHVDQGIKEVWDATFHADTSMVHQLKPKYIMLHDVLDFATRNHHRINDPQERYARAFKGKEYDQVEQELWRAIDWLDNLPETTKPIVVASNHDEAFDRWLKTTHPTKEDPVNAKLYHRMWYDLIERYEREGRWVPAFMHYYEQESKAKRAKFLWRDESFMIDEVECGYHGDKGINGARGSKVAYAKLGIKTSTGHSHSPSIRDGNHTAGVCSGLHHGYNQGPSSWMVANDVIYANGKRTLLFIMPSGNWHG